jgi:hypothetical protein
MRSCMSVMRVPKPTIRCTGALSRKKTRPPRGTAWKRSCEDGRQEFTLSISSPGPASPPRRSNHRLSVAMTKA